MDKRTKSLLEAARWVVEQSMDESTGGRNFTEAIINLSETIHYIDEEESLKKTEKCLRKTLKN